MDRLTENQRARTMRAIKSKGSKIEKTIRAALREQGLEFETNYDGAQGKPDIAFPDLKIAVFCDSDFWHGYNWDEHKHDFKSNQEFWWNKIERNMERDKEVTQQLTRSGWTVIRLWGHQIREELDDCLQEIQSAIQQRKREMSP